MPETDDRRPQLDEFLEIRKPGAHLEEGVVADDFVLMLGVDLVNFPKFPQVDDNVTYPKADLDIRQELDVDSGRRARRLQRSVPRRPALHRLLGGRARHEVHAVERGVPPALRRRLGRRGRQALRHGDHGRDRVGRVERPGRPRARAHARRVPARRHRGTTDPEPAVPEADARTTRVVYTGLFTPARRHRPSSRSSSSSHGCSGATSTCCSASRRGPRRSSCATGSTRCSTSSARCGATTCCPASRSSRPSGSASPATRSPTG